jgi:hypothetical protein
MGRFRLDRVCTKHVVYVRGAQRVNFRTDHETIELLDVRGFYYYLRVV